MWKAKRSEFKPGSKCTLILDEFLLYFCIIQENNTKNSQSSKEHSTVALNTVHDSLKSFLWVSDTQYTWENGNKTPLIYCVFFPRWTTADCKKIKRLLRTEEDGKTKQNCEHKSLAINLQRVSENYNSKRSHMQAVWDSAWRKLSFF